jgi:hypothetical protein
LVGHGPLHLVEATTHCWAKGNYKLGSVAPSLFKTFDRLREDAAGHAAPTGMARSNVATVGISE